MFKLVETDIVAVLAEVAVALSVKEAFVVIKSVLVEVAKDKAIDVRSVVSAELDGTFGLIKLEIGPDNKSVAGDRTIARCIV